MENIQDTSIFGLDIDDEGKSQLSAIAQWANINAIVAFASLGLSLISTVMAFSNASRYLTTESAGSGIVGLLVSLVISLVLNITLIAAASNIKKGIDQANQGLFGIGLTKLASYFKIVGILTIIVLVFVGLALLVTIMVGAGRAF
jgi:hypothetical protein